MLEGLLFDHSFRECNRFFSYIKRNMILLSEHRISSQKSSHWLAG